MSAPMTPRTFLVLDLETRPDPKAVAISPGARRGDRPALHEIHAYSSLRAAIADDGSWRDVHLSSAMDLDEFDLLMRVDDELARLAADDGTLVTFNGLRHDVPMIRRRAAAHWMFGLPGIDALSSLRHRDLMLEASGARGEAWPSLRDLCAGYGIPTNHMLVGRGAARPLPVRKSQVDCVATLLLLLFDMAVAAGDEAVLVDGWTALASHLAEPRLRAPHLDQFRWHPRLAEHMGEGTPPPRDARKTR